MAEFEMLRSVDPLIASIVWQASGFLIAGLAASVVLRNRPARGHQALLLAILAALIAPALTEGGRRLGWGLLASPRPTASLTAVAPAPTATTAMTATAPPLSPRRLVPQPVSMPRSVAPANLGSPVQVADDVSVRASFPWRSVLATVWGSASALLAMRLGASFLGGRRLARRARLVDDPELQERLKAAATGWGLSAAPAVARSAEVACPAVWCWGRRPLLLLPDRDETTPLDWVGVFRHELAHWQRRDHLSALAGEVLVCILPWHPLAWAARARLAQLAELACDDWVLAAGTPASDYAEALLGLTPQRLTPALAAVSSHGGLRSRLLRILSDHRPEPTAGRRWTIAACLGMAGAASIVALAQARPAVAVEDPPKLVETPKEAADVSPKTLRGRVLDPDGRPRAGATVYWVGQRKPRLPFVALPRGDRESRPALEAIAETQTDEDGGFTLKAPFNPENYERYNGVHVHLVATAPGVGLVSSLVDAKEEKLLTLRFPREEIIQGRLLTPAGMPAAGVRVLFQGYHDSGEKEGLYVGLIEKDENLPAFWPRPLRTDADGRFTMTSVPVGAYAALAFWHPDFAVDEVTVNTIPDRAISESLKGFEIVPVEPSFEYALEPARPVEGRVTDKTTGEPLANVFVQVTAMRRHGGMPFSTRTDADGRYRVSGHVTDGTYFIAAFPSPDSGYLSLAAQREGGKIAQNVIHADLPLDRGRTLTGRVVDQEGRAPIAGAAVVYQPTRKNPNNTRNYDLRSPITTDADGRFRITTLAGEGYLAVETPSEDYIRASGRAADRPRNIHPQGFLNVDVPKEGDVPDVEIALRKAPPLVVRVLDPDGRPTEAFLAMFNGIDAKLIDMWNHGRPFTNGRFTIPGADPERTYRVFFINAARRLGAVADLKPPADGHPLEVRLQPTATIKGKIADADRIQGIQAYVRLILSSERKEYKPDELVDQDVSQFYSNLLSNENFHFHREQPGPDGTFAFEAIIPDSGLCVTAADGGGREANLLVWDLKPGEVRDVGTLTLKEEPR